MISHFSAAKTIYMGCMDIFFCVCGKKSTNPLITRSPPFVCMQLSVCCKNLCAKVPNPHRVYRERDRERNARFIRFMYISCQWCECHSNAVECECIKTFNTNPAPSDPVYYACPRECRSRATFGELCYELIMWEFPLWLTWCSLESA
jgi:hypothetical protein